MFLIKLLISIVILAVAMVLFSVKLLFKKNGRFEKSCVAEQRIMKEKNLDCKNCNLDPLSCEQDQTEHEMFH